MTEVITGFVKGDLCMTKYAPKNYDYLNGWVVKLQQYSLNSLVDSWYTEEELPTQPEGVRLPIPEDWLWKFEVGA